MVHKRSTHGIVKTASEANIAEAERKNKWFYMFKKDDDNDQT